MRGSWEDRESIRRISTSRDYDRLCSRTPSCQYSDVYTFYVYVSSSKRVKERIWKKFVCAMAGFVVSLEYRDETCFFIPITLSFSF